MKFSCENAHISSADEYQLMYQESIANPEGFWEKMAQILKFQAPYDRVLFNNSWFLNGKINACENCVDRWAFEHPNKPALYWVGDEVDEKQVITYNELLQKTCQLANFLRNGLGLKKHDCVVIYMPMIPEVVFTMLACARIGVIHSVVFAGFSDVALASRIDHAGAKAVITCDYGRRGGRIVPLLEMVCKALGEAPIKVLYFEHDPKMPGVTGEGGQKPLDNRFYCASDHLHKHKLYCPLETMDSDDTLFILYTSGSTGKPKALAHSTAGYLLYAATTHKYVFDIRPDDIFFCAADVGWITGHTYLVYGPLCNGVATVIFESVPTYPTPARYWQTIEELRCTQFYGAPTAFRSLQSYSVEDFVSPHDLTSLRVLGSVGEPLNPSSWHWLMENVCKQRIPIVDTYWQTETGGIVISPLPFASTLKPGSCSWPFFGIIPKIESSAETNSGHLCLEGKWPGRFQTILGDHSLVDQIYMSTYPGVYYTSDGVYKDADGLYYITGRVDDCLNVSGHRIATAEIESAITQLAHLVSDAGVVGYPHSIKGQGIFCFVCLKNEVEEGADTKQAIRTNVREQIGAIASPDIIVLVPDLPKTRSGKCLRRILRKIAEGYACPNQDMEALRADLNPANFNTLANPEVIEQIEAQVKACISHRS